jgi:DNA-binding CsgD family transcriptional regulator
LPIDGQTRIKPPAFEVSDLAKIDLGRLQQIGTRLGDTVVDPAVWPEIMEDICAATHTTGALMLQGDNRTPDIPRTASFVEAARSYFENNWHMKDIRAARGVPRLMSGSTVVTDQDIMSPNEMSASAFYNELLLPLGFKWFAGIKIRAGSALWALSLQRTVRENPFTADDCFRLATLSEALSEAATLSTEVGRAVFKSALDALDSLGRPAIILDRLGFVLEVNCSADALFDAEIFIRRRRLILADLQAGQKLDKWIQQLATVSDLASLPPEQLVVRRSGKASVLIRRLSVSSAARGPFLGARALLVLSDFASRPQPRSVELARIFKLTPAESRLASSLASGDRLEFSCEQLGISKETARSQLKSIFAKTGTKRQAELVLLLSKIL